MDVVSSLFAKDEQGQEPSLSSQQKPQRQSAGTPKGQVLSHRDFDRLDDEEEEEEEKPLERMDPRDPRGFVNIDASDFQFTQEQEQDFLRKQELAELGDDGNDHVGKVIKITKDEGVVKKFLKVGEHKDKPEKNDEVQVLYTGRLVQEGKAEGEGDEFDSNQDRQNPFTFSLGKGQVIKGWDEAVRTMRQGEKSRITIKPEYGYGAAGSGAKIPPNSTLEFDVELLGWKNVNALTPDGKVAVKFLKQSSSGWQDPKDGWEVIVDFVGKANGVEFIRKKDYEFTISSELHSKASDGTLTPPFFSAAIKKFKKNNGNDVGLLTIPPPHHPSQADISADATVTYEITIVKWIVVEGIEGPGTPIKRFLKEAEAGWDKPKDGSVVTVRMTARFAPAPGSTEEEGRVFMELGEATEVKVGANQFPEAVDVALLTMRVGDMVRIEAAADWGYGAEMTRDLGIVEESKRGYIFDVELVEIKSKPQESYEMHKPGEKLADSEASKEMGNVYFKDGKTRCAVRKYEKALKNFNGDNTEEDEKKQVNAMKLSCYLNLAACYNKLEKFDKAVDAATKALAISTHSVKALYRRAQARMKRLELDLAERDINKAIEIDGNDVALKQFARQLAAEIKRNDAKDRAVYQKMFK